MKTSHFRQYIEDAKHLPLETRIEYLEDLVEELIYLAMCQGARFDLIKPNK